MSEKIKVIKITRNSVCGSYVLSREEIKNLLNEIEEMFEEDEIGEIVQIELSEMVKEEFYNLPEFTGW